ncbi:MAG: HIT domain-containing protein [Dehalococcoidia bacterium]|jgi:ATP adenylyltransferase|nr:MAG: HIT domain-containing protein [Dehalococcoidia bacterium]
MKRIWAPWRIQFIRTKKPKGCFLCENPGQNDDVQNYILYRGSKNFVILNGYPYNPGHLMVAPYRHVADLEDFTGEERNEHFEIVSQCVKVLRHEYNSEGFNIGMNLRGVSGAGTADHVHTHIVPRWQGDTNFMPVLADVKVLPEALTETYERLKGKF